MSESNGLTNQTVANGRSLSRMVATIHECRGNLSAVAKAYDVTRSTVSEWVRESLALRLAVHDAREARLDTAEDKLGDAIDGGDAWAVQFILKTQGRKRGYVERHEIQVPNDELDRAIESELAGMASRGEGGPPGEAAGPPQLTSGNGQAEPLDAQQRPADGGVPQPGG